MIKEAQTTARKAGLWLNWLTATAGWLLCAALCLAFTIYMEEFPHAYDVLFPAVLIMLFGNILVFLFIASRWGSKLGILARAVGRVCLGEALLLGGLYCLGRFCIGV